MQAVDVAFLESPPCSGVSVRSMETASVTWPVTMRRPTTETNQPMCIKRNQHEFSIAGLNIRSDTLVVN